MTSRVGQCLVSDENSTCWIPVRHNTQSDGDVKVCVCAVRQYLTVERGPLRTLSTEHSRDAENVSVYVTLSRHRQSPVRLD